MWYNPDYVTAVATKIRDDLKTLQVISFVSPKSYEAAFDELLLALQTQNVPPVTVTPDASLRRSESLRYVGKEFALPVWNIPYRRNPFFTGRETLLGQLRDSLSENAPTALTQAQAISGLGGIGKTQLAVEYAYRYQKSYHDIFWAIADTNESLMVSYVRLADLLHLPEYGESDQSKAKAAMRPAATRRPSATSTL